MLNRYESNIRTICIVSLAVIAVFMTYIFINSRTGVKEAANALAIKNQDLTHALEAGVVQSEDDIKIATAAVDKLKDSIKDLKNRISYVPDKKCCDKVEDLRTKGAEFGRLRGILFDDLNKRSRGGDLNRFRSMGFPVAPDTEEKAAEFVFRLSIIYSVLSAAIENGIYQLDLIDSMISNQESVETDPTKTFIEQHPVRLKFYGEAEKIARVLFYINRPGSFIKVQEVSISRKTPFDDKFLADLKVNGLLINESVKISKSDENEE